MNEKIRMLKDEIRKLEKEVNEEIKSIKIDAYEIYDNTVKFKKDLSEYHRSKMVGLSEYLGSAQIKYILTAPIIWLCIFPAVFLDVVVTFYQFICFPIYKINRVKRSEYIVIDRHYLKYLNVIQKVNCIYCGYFNGLMSYVCEVAARTEKFWCPIKHARQLKNPHPYYGSFSEFGDCDDYHEVSNPDSIAASEKSSPASDKE